MIIFKKNEEKWRFLWLKTSFFEKSRLLTVLWLKMLEKVILTTYNVITIIEKNPNGKSSSSSSLSKVPNGRWWR